MNSVRNTNFMTNLIKFCYKNRIKLCIKCLLRFCEVKNFPTYKKTCIELNDTSVLAINHIEEWINLINIESICYSCLDLLCDTYCDEVVHNIYQYLTSSKCEHKFNTFQLFISIPVSITLRNELLIKKFKNFNQCPDNDLTVDESEINFQSIFAVKDIFKSIVINGLEKRLIDKPFDTNSSFNITVDFTHEESDNECQEFYRLSPKAFFPKKCSKSGMKSYINQSSIVRALAAIRPQVVIEWPITEPNAKCVLQSIKSTQNPIYIAGRYLKYSRSLSQTPWILEGQRLMASSVQDIIQDQIQELIVCDHIKFSASGREDVDVRMLGRGRPFVLEVYNPRVTHFDDKQLSQMMSAINDSQSDVFVRDLQIVSKQSIQIELKEGEKDKTKTYRAICCLSRPFTDDDRQVLADVNDLVIDQKTPIRVLHRRTLSVRQKHIYKLWTDCVTEADIPEEHRSGKDRIFCLHLTTEAGTYIKEFVHSDFGRTKPNLGTILDNCSADILQLDVMDINIDWPPVVDNSEESIV